MISLRNENINLLYNKKEDITRKNAFSIGSNEPGHKFSIVSDSFFSAVFIHEGRIKNSAKLLSYIIDVSYEDLLKNLHFSKQVLDKAKKKSKTERCDLVANLNDTILNVELNNNASIETLERNMDYAFRLFSIKNAESKKYIFRQIIQVNLNNFSFVGHDETIESFYIQSDKHVVYSKKIIFVNISLPNIYKKWYNNGVNALNELEKLLLILAETNINNSKDIGKGDKFMEKLIDETIDYSLDPDLLDSIDLETYMKDIGRNEGIEQGIAQKTKDAAINLYNNGASKDLIMKSLNISEEELAEYLKDNNS